MGASGTNGKEIETRVGRIELWEGELFMLARRRRKVTQIMLQVQTGISQVAISRWEAGMSMPEKVSQRLWESLEMYEVREKPTRPALAVPSQRASRTSSPTGDDPVTSVA